MQVYITRPRDLQQSVLVDNLSTLWDRAATGHSLEYITPEPHATHGDTLTTLYARLLTMVPRPQRVLISEIDFAVAPFALSVLDKLLDEYAIVTPNYVRRDADGAPTRYPLSAPWFFAFNLSAFTNDPNLFWLDAAGPYNDAANCAVQYAIDEGCVPADKVKWLAGTDPGPEWLGMTYPLLGHHCFWTRHWDDHTKIIAPNYTMVDHLIGFAQRVGALLAEGA